MKNHKPKCFILIPNKEFALPLKRALGKKGIAIHTQFDQGTDEQLSLNSFDAAIAFFENPRGDNANHRTHRAVYFSNQNGSEDLIEAQKDGLYDFSKIQALNLNAEKIISHLDHILLNSARAPKNRTTKGEAALAKIIGKSLQIKKAKDLIQRISQFPDAPVLITGETGTGKELVTNALHACSPRANKPLIKINSSAIPETLFESQLFGHRKGAFSGAVVQQKGLVEQANNGVLFLDEISSLKLELQPKLLRFLEDGSYLPVGEMRERKSNAWVIAATNQKLEELVDSGQFREDLYFRLKALEIGLPPLKERANDILELAEQFLLDQVEKNAGLERKELSNQARKGLLNYDWPGNVRELKQKMLKYAIDSGAPIEVKQRKMPSCLFLNGEKVLPLNQIEELYVKFVLEQTGSSIRRSAELLGIDRKTLRRKIKRYGVRLPGQNSP